MLAEPLAFPFEAPEPGRLLDDAIFALVYVLLEQEPCLSAGEDGAFGTIIFFAVKRAIELENPGKLPQIRNPTPAPSEATVP